MLIKKARQRELRAAAGNCAGVVCRECLRVCRQRAEIWT
jgi:hypothetical protein